MRSRARRPGDDSAGKRRDATAYAGSVALGLAAINLCCVNAPIPERTTERNPAVSASAGSSASGEEDDSASSAGFAGGLVPVPDLGPADSHEEDMQPIWAKNCVIYCHDGSGIIEGLDLDLDRGAAFNAIVNVPSQQVPTMMLVTPGDLDASYLWHKIVDTHLSVGGEGVKMPKEPGSMSTEEADRIGTWILAGCPS